MKLEQKSVKHLLAQESAHKDTESESKEAIEFL